MKNIFICILSLLLLIGISSCTNNNPQPTKDIYVQAMDGDIVKWYYYKNGLKQTLNFAVNGDMVVDGSDVYFPTDKGYYKNGTLYPLPEARGINNIFVKDGTVYATGFNTAKIACYWKGTERNLLLPDTGGKKLFPQKIVVDANNQIHIGGAAQHTSGRNSIFHWHNDIMDTFTRGSLYDMAVKGTDIYMVGMSYTDENVRYWVNGQPQNLHYTDGKNAGLLTSVFVWNNDVYFTSYEKDGGALYWKNEQPYGSIEAGSYATDLVVDNDNVITAVHRGPAHNMGGDYYLELRSNKGTEPLGEGSIRVLGIGK